MESESAAPLAGRVALVTGASGGIGAGLARMLAAEGARVVLAARRQAALEQIADSIRELGGCAVPIAADLTDDASLVNLLERARTELGPIDILVNNAGFAVWKPLEATSLAEWDHTFAVKCSCRGLLVCIRAARHAAKGLRANCQHQ